MMRIRHANGQELTGLEIDIINYIEECYKAKFLGDVIVTKQEDTYVLKLILDVWHAPIWICNDSPDDTSFFEFVKKQIKERRLINTKFFKLVLQHGKQ